jgi:hypothetical protein
MNITVVMLILSLLLLAACAKQSDNTHAGNSNTPGLLQHVWKLKSAYDSVFTLSGDIRPLSQLIIGSGIDSTTFTSNGNEYVSGFTGFFITSNSIGIGSTSGSILQYNYTLINNDNAIARYYQPANINSIVRDTAQINFISATTLVLTWQHEHATNYEHVYDTLIRL